jgi:hypothetical protein
MHDLHLVHCFDMAFVRFIAGVAGSVFAMPRMGTAVGVKLYGWTRA